MRNRYISITICLLFLFLATTLSAQLQIQTSELCSGDLLLSDLTTERIAESQPFIYKINNKHFTGTAVKHLDGNETCTLYIIEKGRILKRWGFFSNGKLSREEYFKEGLPHGICIRYYDNGKKASEINYKSGVLHGNNNEWTKEGAVKRASKYNMGNLISEKF